MHDLYYYMNLSRQCFSFSQQPDFPHALNVLQLHCLITIFHYRRRLLCRVSEALGKGRYTLGKAFAKCYTQQRAIGKQFIDKDLFVKCTLSGTRQRLCRVPIRHSAKKSGHDGECHHDGSFAECQGQALSKGTRFISTIDLDTRQRWPLCRVSPTRHSAKVATLPSVAEKTLGKVATFVECLASGTRQTCDVCRVQWPLHSAKHVSR